MFQLPTDSKIFVHMDLIMTLFLCCAGKVTALAGSSRGYKDGFGPDAQFHHPAGNRKVFLTQFRYWNFMDF